MSDNSVKKRIEDISSDILAQIVHGIKSAFPIALQLDESTDAACYESTVGISTLRAKSRNKT